MALHIDFSERVRKVRAEMEKINLDALLVTKQGDVHYLLGEFAPWRTAVVVPKDGDLVGITVHIDSDRVRKGTWLKDIRLWEWALGSPSFSDVVSQTLKEIAPNKVDIGIQFDNLTLKEFETIRRDLPDVNFVDGSHVVDEVMYVKEDVELDYLRRAAEISDYGIYEAFNALRVGMTETELSGAAEYAMAKAGNEFNWSITGGTEVGSGWRTCYWHGWTEPTTRKMIQPGDMVTIDIHPMYNLYLSDQCNNFILGKPNANQQKLIEAWKEAVHVLFDGLRPGAVAKEVAKKTVKVIEKRGYMEHTSPLFGHGLGTTCRTSPTISVTSEDILQPNTCLVAVVNITQPGIGGMRIETPVRVTENGLEVFSKLPIDIFIKD